MFYSCNGGTSVEQGRRKTVVHDQHDVTETDRFLPDDRSEQSEIVRVQRVQRGQRRSGGVHDGGDHDRTVRRLFQGGRFRGGG